MDDPGPKPDGGPIADRHLNEWRRPLDCDYRRRPSPRMIPDRWMSVTDHVGHRAGGRQGRGTSLGLGLRGCVAGVHDRSCGRGLRWAGSTDADGEGDVRGLPGHGIGTGPLDFATLIDGFGAVGRPTHLRARRSDRPKQPRMSLRASVGSTEASWDQSASVCRTNGTSLGASRFW